MKLTTHARESQATSLCHRENIQKSLQRLYTLVYLISIIASYKYGITRLIIAKDIQKEHVFMTGPATKVFEGTIEIKED